MGVFTMQCKKLSHWTQNLLEMVMAETKIRLLQSNPHIKKKILLILLFLFFELAKILI